MSSDRPARPGDTLDDLHGFLTRPPRALFSVVDDRAARNRSQYDVTPDGERFLMIRENSVSRVVYVENWFAELLAKARQ